jgi:hypothetical protein
MLADVIEHFLHRPGCIDRDQFRRHQTPDTALRITEERLCDAPLFGREQTDQLSCRRARELFEQRCAVIRRHLVEDRDDLFVCHATEQFLLRLDVDVEILENVRRQHVRQNPENDDLLVFRKIEDDLGHVGRRHLGKEFAERGEIPRIDHALDFG